MYMYLQQHAIPSMTQGYKKQTTSVLLDDILAVAVSC